jgi:hypothetical protein
MDDSFTEAGTVETVVKKRRSATTDPIVQEDLKKKARAKPLEQHHKCKFCREEKLKPVGNKEKMSSWKQRRAALTESASDENWIFPCLCNVKAHRKCLLNNVKMKRNLTCDKCSSLYPIHGVFDKFSQRRFKRMLRSMVTILVLLGIVCIIFVIMNQSVVTIPSGVRIIVLVIIYLAIFVLACIFIYYLWKALCQEELVDIDVHCKQNEVSRNLSAKNAFKLYQEYLSLGSSDEKIIVIDSEKYVNVKYAKELSSLKSDGDVIPQAQVQFEKLVRSNPSTSHTVNPLALFDIANGQDSEPSKFSAEKENGSQGFSVASKKESSHPDP